MRTGIISTLQKIKKVSLWKFFLIFSVLFVFGKYSGLLSWKYRNTPFISDANQYYSYLPATFIYNSVIFQSPTEYWLIPTPTGKAVPKMTMGVAIMESPFFLIGDYIAKNHDYERNGYSPPYVWANYFGVIVYVFIGLWFLYKTLLMYFKPLASIITVFIVFYCTNLLYYTLSMGQMSHSFLFSLYCVFLYLVLNWFRNKKLSHLFLFSFVGGLCTVIRPSDILLFLIPLLIGVCNFQDLKERFLYFFSIKWRLLIAFLLFFLPICPQLIYWKIHTGSFVFNTYIGEKFFFSDPQIINFLFSYRKGLFLYTPILIFSFLGFYTLFKKNRVLFWSVFSFTVINIFILSCWWDWSYSGGFGSRALIQSYSVLAIPLCALLNYVIGYFEVIWKKAISLVLVGVVVWYCSVLNLRMTNKYNMGVIHWSDMSKEAYWFMFNKGIYTAEDYATLQKLYKPLDANRMKAGDRNQ